MISFSTLVPTLIEAAELLRPSSVPCRLYYFLIVLLYCVLASFMLVVVILLQPKGQPTTAMPENALVTREDRKDFAQLQDLDEVPDVPPFLGGRSAAKRTLSDEVTPKTEGLVIY